MWNTPVSMKPIRKTWNLLEFLFPDLFFSFFHCNRKPFWCENIHSRYQEFPERNLSFIYFFWTKCLEFRYYWIASALFAVRTYERCAKFAEYVRESVLSEPRYRCILVFQSIWSTFAQYVPNPGNGAEDQGRKGREQAQVGSRVSRNTSARRKWGSELLVIVVLMLSILLLLLLLISPPGP